MYTTILCSKLLFIHLFSVTVLGRCWCAGFSLVVESRDHSLAATCGLPTVVTFAAERRL